MQETIWQNIANIPWWMYVLFFFAIKLSLYSVKPQIVGIKALFVPPLIFIALSVVGLYTTFGITLQNMSIWIVTFFAGFAIGWFRYKLLNIKAIKNNQKIYIPGSWFLLTLIFALFGVRMYFVSLYGFDTQILLQPKFIPFFLIFYGLFSGLMLGKLLYSIRCLKVGPYLEYMSYKPR